MFRKNVLTLAGIAMLGMTGTAFANTETVICQDSKKTGYTVVFNKEEIMAAKEELGAMFEEEVCKVSADLNIEAYETPTAVTVTMSNGNVYNVNVSKNKPN